MRENTGPYIKGTFDKIKTKNVRQTVSPESVRYNRESLQLVTHNNNLLVNNQWASETIELNEITIELPVTTSKNVALTGIFDDTQVYVIKYVINYVIQSKRIINF